MPLQHSISAETSAEAFSRAYVAAERRGAPRPIGGEDYKFKRPHTESRYMLVRSTPLPIRKPMKRMLQLDDELRRQRLEHNRADAASQRKLDQDRAEQTPKRGDQRLAVDESATIMVRVRAHEFDEAESDEMCLLDAHEFKTFIKKRVHPRCSSRSMRLWYRVLDSRHDGSIEWAPFFAFLAREAILRPERPEKDQATRATTADAAVAPAPIVAADARANYSFKYGPPTLGSLYLEGLSALKGRCVDKRGFVSLMESIGFGESVATRAFGLALAHADLSTRRREERAVRAIQNVVRMRETIKQQQQQERERQLEQQQQQLEQHRASAKQRKRSKEFLEGGKPSEGAPAPSPALSPAPRSGYRIKDELRLGRAGSRRGAAGNQKARWGMLQQSDKLNEVIERSLAADLLKTASKKSDTTIDAHALVLALFSCWNPADGGPLGTVMRDWLLGTSAQTVYESSAGSQRQRLKLLTLCPPPDDLPRGTPASSVLPNPLPLLVDENNEHEHEPEASRTGQSFAQKSMV